MSKAFLEILAIAKDNVSNNPSLMNRPTKEVAGEYLLGLQTEVDEVKAELKSDNSVYLEDELSDIAWTYACILALLEKKQYIKNAESVLTQGLEKYQERAPAFLEVGEAAWNKVKSTQKERLSRKHQEIYGRTD